MECRVKGGIDLKKLSILIITICLLFSVGCSSKESKEGIILLNGIIEKIYEIKLPIEESTRNLLKIKKVSKTDKKYPRPYEKILKKPLKKNIK